jgi:hypothetical protein
LIQAAIKNLIQQLNPTCQLFQLQQLKLEIIIAILLEQVKAKKKAA